MPQHKHPPEESHAHSGTRGSNLRAESELVAATCAPIHVEVKGHDLLIPDRFGNFQTCVRPGASIKQDPAPPMELVHGLHPVLLTR